MNHNGKSRDELSRQATLVRSKLLQTVEQLDQRRHDALDLRRQLKTHIRQLAIVGGLVVVGTATAVALTVHRIATEAERRRRDRWRLARTVWRHPERGLRFGQRPFFKEVARSVGLAIVTMAITEPARRALEPALDAIAGRRASGERRSAS